MRRVGMMVVLAISLASCSASTAQTELTSSAPSTTVEPTTAVKTAPGGFSGIGAGISVNDPVLAPSLSGSVELAGTAPDVGYRTSGVIYRVDATKEPVGAGT